MKNYNYTKFNNNILKSVQVIWVVEGVNLSRKEIYQALAITLERSGYQVKDNSEYFSCVKNSIMVFIHDSVVLISVNGYDYVDRKSFGIELKIVLESLKSVGVLEINAILCNKLNEIKFSKKDLDLIKLEEDQLDDLVFSPDYLRKEAIDTIEKNETKLYIKREKYDKEDSIIFNLYLMTVHTKSCNIDNTLDVLEDMHTLIYQKFIDCISDYLYDSILEK